MSDAIAVFRPKDPERLKPFLDLDEESEESEGLYAEELEDGAWLVHTFQPYAVFAENPAEVAAWLEQFGDALADVHDDPRGLLFFPDDHEPEAATYDAVVAEMADKGIFVPIALDEAASMEALQSLAGMLGGQPGSSFEIGKMFADVQQQLAEALGVDEMLKGESPVIDDEFEPEDPKKK